MKDMLATSLAWPLPDRAASVRAWLQLVDLLGTDAVLDAVDLPLLDAAYARLEMLQRSLGDDAAGLAAPLLHGRVLPDRLRLLLGTTGELDAATGEESPILDLIERIDAYRAQPAAPAPGGAAEPAGFAFAIDQDGRFSDAAGVRLAAQAAPDPQGLDGQALGAWRDHAEIINARLSLSVGAFAGDWRISAAPSFDGNGRFQGYTGWARLPRADEDAAPAALPGLPPEVVKADRFDRAVAALRAPLSGVTGFAGDDLPDGDARAAAAEVVERSLELADAIDSFDLAAEAAAEPQRIEAADLLARIHGALLPLAEARRVALSFRIVQDLPPVDVDAHLVERMFARLVGASVALGRRGERMVVRLGRDRADGSRLALVMTRPGRLTGRPPAELETTGAGSADAPMLAFGFALRLVDRLAVEAGGGLTILDDRLVLSLPLRAVPQRRITRG